MNGFETEINPLFYLALTLIPAKNRNGADHNGEDGRYVETLIREYLKRYLPEVVI